MKSIKIIILALLLSNCQKPQSKEYYFVYNKSDDFGTFDDKLEAQKVAKKNNCAVVIAVYDKDGVLIEYKPLEK